MSDNPYEDILSEDAKAGKALWEQAVLFPELCELMAQFIEGKIKYIPGYSGEELDEESQPLIHYLAAFNRTGFLTDCSQPGLDEGHSKQRAFVTGFALESVAALLQRLSLTTDLYVSVSRPGEINGCRMPVTMDIFRAHTWAGDTWIDEETGRFTGLEHFEKICNPLAFGQLEQACYVSIVDLCWGRKEYLWNELAKELCLSLEDHNDEIL